MPEEERCWQGASWMPMMDGTWKAGQPGGHSRPGDVGSACDSSVYPGPANHITAQPFPASCPLRSTVPTTSSFCPHLFSKGSFEQLWASPCSLLVSLLLFQKPLCLCPWKSTGCGKTAGGRAPSGAMTPGDHVAKYSADGHSGVAPERTALPAGRSLCLRASWFLQHSQNPKENPPRDAVVWTSSYQRQSV